MRQSRETKRFWCVMRHGISCQAFGGRRGSCLNNRDRNYQHHHARRRCCGCVTSILSLMCRNRLSPWAHAEPKELIEALPTCAHNKRMLVRSWSSPSLTYTHEWVVTPTTKTFLQRHGHEPTKGVSPAAVSTRTNPRNDNRYVACRMVPFEMLSRLSISKSIPLVGR